MRILNWNVAFLPNYLNLFKNSESIVFKVLDKIYTYSPDVICLQEIFDLNVLKKVKNSLKSENYDIHHSSLENSLISRNGLLTASKIEILEKSEKDYENFMKLESFIKKGVISSKIKEDLVIHNTQIQTPFFKNYLYLNRDYQIEQFSNYLKDFRYENNIICGDLNEDYFKDFTSKNKEIITFPGLNCQLDYILLDKSSDQQFFIEDLTKSKISNHSLTLTELKL